MKNDERPQPQYENYQPQKRIRIEYSPVRSRDVYLEALSDDDDEETRKAKKARRERAASDYLHYGSLPIMTARLHGPFGKGWRNPWKRKREGSLNSDPPMTDDDGGLSSTFASNAPPATPSSPVSRPSPLRAPPDVSIKPVRRSLREAFRDNRTRVSKSTIREKPASQGFSSPLASQISNTHEPDKTAPELKLHKTSRFGKESRVERGYHGAMRSRSRSNMHSTARHSQLVSNIQSPGNQNRKTELRTLKAQRQELKTRLRELETRLKSLDLVRDSDSASVLAEMTHLATRLKRLRDQTDTKSKDFSDPRLRQQPLTSTDVIDLSSPPSERHAVVGEGSQSRRNTSRTSATAPALDRRQRLQNTTPAKAIPVTVHPSKQHNESTDKTRAHRTRPSAHHEIPPLRKVSPQGVKSNFLRRSLVGESAPERSSSSAIASNHTRLASGYRGAGEDLVEAYQMPEGEGEGKTGEVDTKDDVIAHISSREISNANERVQYVPQRFSLSQPIPSKIDSNEEFDANEFRIRRGRSESLTRSFDRTGIGSKRKIKPSFKLPASQNLLEFEYRVTRRATNRHELAKNKDPLTPVLPKSESPQVKDRGCQKCVRTPQGCICGIKVVIPKSSPKPNSVKSMDEENGVRPIPQEVTEIPAEHLDSPTKVENSVITKKIDQEKQQPSISEIIDISDECSSQCSSDADFSRFVSQALREDTPPAKGLDLDGYMSQSFDPQLISAIQNKLTSEEQAKVSGKEKSSTSEEAAQKVSRRAPNVSTEELQTERSPLQFASTDLDASYAQFSTQAELDRARKSFQDDLRTPTTKISQSSAKRAGRESLDWLGSHDRALATQDLLAAFAPFDASDLADKEWPGTSKKLGKTVPNYPFDSQKSSNGDKSPASISSTGNAASVFHSAREGDEEQNDADICFSSQIERSSKKPNGTLIRALPSPQPEEAASTGDAPLTGCATSSKVKRRYAKKPELQHRHSDLLYSHPDSSHTHSPQSRNHPELQLSQKLTSQQQVHGLKSHQPTPSGKTVSRSTGTELQDAQKERWEDLYTEAVGDVMDDWGSFLDTWDIERDIASISTSSTDASNSAVLKSSMKKH